jgi:hypothetical protein
MPIQLPVILLVSNEESMLISIRQQSKNLFVQRADRDKLCSFTVSFASISDNLMLSLSRFQHISTCLQR